MLKYFYVYYLTRDFISNFVASINYFEEQKLLHQLNKDLQSETEYLSKNSVDNWYENYIGWANTTVPQYVTMTCKYIDRAMTPLKVFFQDLCLLLPCNLNIYLIFICI